MTKPFEAGVNPMSGEQALRSRVYEALKMFPHQVVTPRDMFQMMPEFGHRRIQSAMLGLCETPQAYPGVHRIGRGSYMFDPSRTASWVTFPNVSKANRKSHNRRALAAAKKFPVLQTSTVQAAPIKQAAPVKAVAPVKVVEQAKAVVAEATMVSSFVAVLPVFDNGKMCPMDKEVLLRDADGNFWHATRV